MSALRYLTLTGLIFGGVFALLAFMPAWPGEMFAAFRGQFVILSLVAVGLSLWLDRRWLIGLAAGVLLMNIVPVVVRYLDRPVLPETADGAPVSLVFANVLFENRQYDDVIALAEQEGPDIFAAAETSPQWIEALQPLKAHYPYSYAHEASGVSGMVVYARSPFSAQSIRGGSRGMVVIRAEFDDFVLYVGHPMPPMTPELTQDHVFYMQQMAHRIGSETKPVILTGDLNATLWSNSMGYLTSERLQWPYGAGIARTWPRSNLLLGIQIDHVLTKGFAAGRFRPLDAIGSDHLPVRADLVLPNRP